jgi:hypothetical protein
MIENGLVKSDISGVEMLDVIAQWLAWSWCSWWKTFQTAGRTGGFAFGRKLNLLPRSMTIIWMKRKIPMAYLENRLHWNRTWHYGKYTGGGQNLLNNVTVLIHPIIMVSEGNRTGQEQLQEMRQPGWDGCWGYTSGIMELGSAGTSRWHRGGWIKAPGCLISVVVKDRWRVRSCCAGKSC